jgi:hypothetical protein
MISIASAASACRLMKNVEINSDKTAIIATANIEI